MTPRFNYQLYYLRFWLNNNFYVLCPEQYDNPRFHNSKIKAVHSHIRSPGTKTKSESIFLYCLLICTDQRPHTSPDPGNNYQSLSLIVLSMYARHSNRQCRLKQIQGRLSFNLFFAMWCMWSGFAPDMTSHGLRSYLCLSISKLITLA